MDEVKVHIDAYLKKVALCQENCAKVTADSEAKKVVELVEKTGERKHLNNSLDEQANTLLRERKAYVFAQIKRGGAHGEGDEIVENVVVDGACIRTPEEDITWAAKQLELEAEAAKGTKKGGPPAKKKWLTVFLILILKWVTVQALTKPCPLGTSKSLLIIVRSDLNLLKVSINDKDNEIVSLRNQYFRLIEGFKLQVKEKQTVIEMLSAEDAKKMKI